MHPMINVAIKAARSAGNIINRASLNLERLQVARKQQNDFVTEVDQAAGRLKTGDVYYDTTTFVLKVAP